MRDALRCAVVLAEAKNYHRAAKLLGVSQPHLSRVIQSLEKRLGVKLFDRNRGGMDVSADGKAVLRDATKLLKAEDKFLAQVAAIRSKDTTKVRIAVAAYVSQTWLGGAIADLTRAHPEISIRVQEVEWWDLTNAVVGKVYDLAIGETSEAELLDEIAIESFPLRKGGIIVRADHPLATRANLTLEQIAEFPAAGPRLPGRVARVLPKTGKLGNVTKDGQYYVPMIECATPQASITVVSESNAFCMIPPQMCKDELLTGKLIELPIHPPWLHLRQGIMRLRGRSPSAAEQTVIAAAKMAERKYFAA